MSDYGTTRRRDDATNGAVALYGQWSVVSPTRSYGAAGSSQWSSRESGFTLAELVVSIGVLVLLVLLFTQLLNSAATVTTLGQKQMDGDSQAREVLDRMAIDLAQMVKRPDVDYYLKASGSAIDCGVCGTQPGNDQAAFYSTVAGYYLPGPSYTDKSPVSLLSYRINSNITPPYNRINRMERLGKGLAWIGFSPSWTPIMFLPQTIGGPQPLGGNWPVAVSSSATNAECNNTGCYEVIGPQVFRFEYYYLLKTGSFSTTPWDTTAGHTNVSGMRDVSAIVADIAVIEPKSRQLIDNRAQVPPPNDNISLLSGALADYSGQAPGVLLATWRNTLDANNIGLPRPAIPGIRVYERYFYLNP